MELTKKRKDEDKIQSTRGMVYNEPLCDIYETSNEFKILFDVPGVDKENINIKVEKDILTLIAETKKTPVEDYKTIRQEMDFAGYKRSFSLSNVINSEKIGADYNNGVLTLTLPKREEQKTKEISIKIS